MNYNLNDNGGFLSPRSIVESYNMSVAKENDELKKQLEAYKNMKKELLELILFYFPALDQRESNFKDELLNILNKVGDDNDTN